MIEDDFSFLLGLYPSFQNGLHLTIIACLIREKATQFKRILLLFFFNDSKRPEECVLISAARGGGLCNVFFLIDIAVFNYFK